MIDPRSEDLILPSAATAMFPPSRRGKKIDVKVVYRYMRTGCRGVVLESLRTPRLVTSREAVARFIRRLSDLDRTNLPPARDRVTRAWSNRRVEQELDRIGI